MCFHRMFLVHQASGWCPRDLLRRPFSAVRRPKPVSDPLLSGDVAQASQRERVMAAIVSPAIYSTHPQPSQRFADDDRDGRSLAPVDEFGTTQSARHKWLAAWLFSRHLMRSGSKTFGITIRPRIRSSRTRPARLRLHSAIT